jgi:molybdate transport repressor ModE-like protein
VQTSRNLARLDFVSINLLVQCASRGSISAAAEHCHLSVMGASGRLRRLEDTLGKPLFHRQRHGLAPTQAGEAALRCARSVLAAIGEMVAEVAAMPPNPPGPAQNSGRRAKSRGNGRRERP